MAGVPYVSHVKLFANAHSAMLSAIELFNKPRIEYRNETTAILVTNAWELALKGLLRRHRVRIFKKKERGRPYESIGLDQCLEVVRNRKLWPASLDGAATAVNIQALQGFRNRAIHLYNADGLGTVIYSYLQQAVLNFRDFLVAVNGRDLAESITWDLLPLAATTPSEAVQFMRVDPDARTLPAINEFLVELRRGIESVEDIGGDTGRIYTYYDVALHSKKRASAADLSVAVDQDADGKILKRTYDPNDGHPLTATELLKKVNAKRKAKRDLTTHDRTAAVWHSNMRENPEYAWKHSTSLSHVYSHAAVAFLVSQPDTYYDEARKAYKEHLAQRRSTG
ncbi:DUF3644 domain-containing protein [Enemella sp. A6]|uniref:DUF3644 domain-containing protein n=1 Tax=Enemella sp. A6 TaxID=3440152 RepID=UPI003EB6B0E1